MPNISLYFVRHGQRLDQVDPSWAETSPCPQDPPLTDQGKRQARQTGKMIRDFAHESRSLSTPISFAALSKRVAKEDASVRSDDNNASQKDWTTVQRITPPESPDLGHSNSTTTQKTDDGAMSTRDIKRQHHFAIVTSPFLRCSQTAIEIALGMKMSAVDSNSSDKTTITSSASNNSNPQENGRNTDLVTISVESGLAGKSIGQHS
ncbi:hypothetical protein BGZ49_009913 [Haplosporangium sp. Z 27]|nr:hypothetical protein BGZ49_009913 [Haplosporangium sp. Z 27]